jgi:parallel beta-helix repeat protein
VQKTKLTLIAIMLVLSTAQSVNLVSSNVFAQIPPINSVYIRADGSIEPSTAPITIENNVYTLTGDLTNTTLKIERDGIILDGAGYTITGNDIHFHAGVDISNRTNITIRNMDINQFGTGILVNEASKNTLRENKIFTYQAFRLINADNNNIVGNTAINRGYGIVGTGSYNQITDNNFSRHLTDSSYSMGISLESSNNNTLSRNNISHGIGINLADCHSNTISNNTLIGNGAELGSRGVLLTRSSNNLLFGNIIKEKTSVDSAAIHFSLESFNNIIFENTFEKNRCAIAFCYYSVEEERPEKVHNNTLYRNFFLNNVNNVRIAKGTPVNYWDKNHQGNFWGDYSGADNNGDGIGDAPYIIDENNRDNYPLIEPVVILEFPERAEEVDLFLITLVISSIVSVAVVGVGLMIYFKKHYSERGAKAS